ncbi:MAG: hypothetical protein PUF65_11010 [Lachnospiraceae bacterium]|nr:hypothetical protein [Lachnospiraceae bacterium]
MKKFLPVFLIIAVLFAFSLMTDHITSSNDREQIKILETAVTRSISECYALEGAYPPDISYLSEHYGLTYDTQKYFIDYQYIGSNLRPDVTIIKRTE